MYVSPGGELFVSEKIPGFGEVCYSKYLYIEHTFLQKRIKNIFIKQNVFLTPSKYVL